MRTALLVGCGAALVALSITAYAAQSGRLGAAPEDPVVTTVRLKPVAQDTTPPRAELGRSTAPEPDPAWVHATATAAGVPEVALRAYARASLRAPQDCHLGWATMAGVGWVESHHGTIGDRTLDASGRPSEPIFGPALDGRGKVARIPASVVGTSLHGDSQWEHALGPMQFLPETWVRYEVDADGDGGTDPQDLDDAALAAADYLCSAGGDLATSQGWSRAVLAYNNSTDYLMAVHAAATAYGQRVG